MDNRFTVVGIRPVPDPVYKKKPWHSGKPLLSMAVLAVMVIGCIVLGSFPPKDPTYMDLYHAGVAPNAQFWFGTDTLGRDIFSMIWHGGQISLGIGLMATAISTAIAILFGTVSGLAPRWLDSLLMRLTEIFLSIPGLLLIILIQAILGEANALSIAFAIGITGWTAIAKVIRTEVRQLRSCGYVVAARCMGAGFFRILWKHLTPNFISSVMFMVVMNVSAAIGAESTLSFMGIGLPLETISWGSMLSLAEKALASGSWWMIMIPGVFLVATLLCLTNIGNFLRKNANRSESNL